MKLITTITPRRDGVVRVKLPSGGDVVFTKDAEGQLAADVEQDSDVAHLLALPEGNFEPADTADFARAEILVESVIGGDADDDGADDEDGDDDTPGADDELPNGGLPVEANTAPAPAATGKAAKAAKAAAKG